MLVGGGGTGWGGGGGGEAEGVDKAGLDAGDGRFLIGFSLLAGKFLVVAGGGTFADVYLPNRQSVIGLR